MSVILLLLLACVFVSLHIRSMWETICEASASCSGKNLCSKIPVYPILGFGPKFIPPPRKLKFGHDLALWVLTTPRIPPPHPSVSGSSYGETNFCISRGYHLVVQVKETLRLLVTFTHLPWCYVNAVVCPQRVVSCVTSRHTPPN